MLSGGVRSGGIQAVQEEEGRAASHAAAKPTHGRQAIPAHTSVQVQAGRQWCRQWQAKGKKVKVAGRQRGRKGQCKMCVAWQAGVCKGGRQAGRQVGSGGGVCGGR